MAGVQHLKATLPIPPLLSGRIGRAAKLENARLKLIET
jgi:hypothetical protein